MGHSMKSSETSMAYFPQHLIDEILTRLPVKSLIRFKCISEYWNDLISNNPHFAKLHHKRTTQHPNPLTRTTLAVISRKRLALQSIGCTTLFDKNIIQEIQDLQSRLDLQVFDLAKKRVSFRYLACSNGLVCGFTCGYKAIYIWNPATRLHRKLPSPALPKYSDSEIYAAGFGYIDSKDDYMVLALIQPGNIHKIYSLSTDKWTTVTPKYNDEKFHRPSDMGTYLNGAIHWLVSSTHEDSIDSIMAFDLVTETYFEIVLPDYRDIYPHLLFVFEECLGVIFVRGHHHYFSTWTMKEYNRKESWTKFSLQVPALKRMVAIPLLRSSTDDNQVLVVNADNWNAFRDLNVNKLEAYSDWIFAGVNVESLASIYPKKTNHELKQLEGPKEGLKRQRST